MPINAVIFDCDGVLVDSLGLADAVLAEYLLDLGFALSPQEAATRFDSGKLADAIARFELEMARSLPEHFELELRRRRDKSFRERLQPVSGARELIQALTVPSAVASNGPLAQVELSLRVVGMFDLFQQRIFSAYSVGAWKPDPRLFLHASQVLGVPPSECAVIEDSELGVEAGLAAGMQVFALRPGGDRSAHAGARSVQHLSELRRYL